EWLIRLGWLGLVSIIAGSLSFIFVASFNIFFILLCLNIGKTLKQWSDMANPSSLANADDNDGNVDVNVNTDADLDHYHSKGAMEMASMSSNDNNTSQQDKSKTNSSGSGNFKDNYYIIKDVKSHRSHCADVGRGNWSIVHGYNKTGRVGKGNNKRTKAKAKHSWQCRAKAFTRSKRKNDGGMAFDVSFLCFVLLVSFLECKSFKVSIELLV
ncbi:hypothetical protein RFI_25178, partial [Reticulomyxa filosa]